MERYFDDIAANSRDIAFLRERVVEQLNFIEESFYYDMKTDTRVLDKLSNLLEMYSTAACENPELKKDADSMERKFRSLAERSRYFSSHVLENFNVGFDTYEYEGDSVPAAVSAPAETGVKIKGIYPWNSYSPNKIEYRNGGVYSGKRFGRGDVIERAPVRLLQDGDLYSRAVRNFAFEVDSANGVYAIPFGYATYYRNAASLEEANACYDFESSDSDGTISIVIRSIGSIPKDSEIVIYRDPAKFANELRPNDFNRRGGRAVMQGVKNYRFV